jgi:flagellar M-ring protein FliF
MDVLKRAADQVKGLWSGLTPVRKIVASACVAAALLLVVWGSTSAGGNGMSKVAGAEMRDDERAQIVRKLKERNQPFEVRNGEIYLPKADAERVMFELNADGVFSDDVFQKYLETNILETGTDKERKFQIGLQKKLELMIRNIKVVRNAAVQVTPQVESERFFKDAPKAGASVQLDLHPGQTLSGENVNAVAGLVARSVRGLDPDRVHIMDTAGRVYRARKDNDSARSAADIRDIEIQYEDRIKADIQQILPEARVVVRAKLQLSETRIEDITQKNPVVQSEEDRRVEGSSGGAVPAVSGIKGGSDAVESGGASVLPKPSERVTKVTYTDPGKTHKIVHTPAGTVEKISVSVLIPVREGDLERERQNEARYKEIIVNAAGSEADKNSVSLMFVPTRPPAPLPVPTFWDETREMLSSRAASTAGIVALGLAVLGILYAVLRRAMPGGVVEDLQSLQARLSDEAALLPEPGVPLGEEDVARVRGGLKDMAARNPRAIAGILKRWLAGK